MYRCFFLSFKSRFDDIRILGMILRMVSFKIVYKNSILFSWCFQDWYLIAGFKANCANERTNERGKKLVKFERKSGVKVWEREKRKVLLLFGKKNWSVKFNY